MINVLFAAMPVHDIHHRLLQKKVQVLSSDQLKQLKMYLHAADTNALNHHQITVLTD